MILSTEKPMIYFIEAEKANLIKIGMTKSHPVKRLRALSNVSPDRLKLLGTINESDEITEAKLHRRFASSRHHGEWFAPSEELSSFIEENVGVNRFVITTWDEKDEERVEIF